MPEQDSIHTALLLLMIAAALFFPGMMIAYWFCVVRYRMDDIRSALWNIRAIELYVKLFTGLRVDCWGRLETRSELVQRASDPSQAFHAILLRDFKTVHSVPKYVLSVISVTFVVGLVVWTCGTWAQAWLEGEVQLAERMRPTTVMALAGAYTWSVFGVLSRYRSRDLVPEDLMEMFLRYIAAVPIGHAFAAFSDGPEASALAFASAAFPLRELRLVLRERALKKVAEGVAPVPRGGEGRLSRLLPSLGEEALARLEELHVVTYMDMAYLNPTRLMARSGYSLRLILTWIDQALLVVYAGPHLERFVQFGLPCALDAREFYREHIQGRAAGEWRAAPAVVELARALEVSLDSVREMLKRIDEDPHVEFLQAIWAEGPARATNG